MGTRKKKWVIGIVIAILSIIVLMGIATVIINCNNTLYIAHRGYGACENTEEAFYNSTKYWGIECDVRMTLDGKIVINHDEDVILEDKKTYSIADNTFETLTSKKLKSGYNLCTFSRYLQICKELGKISIVELKSTWQSSDVSKLLNEIETNYSSDNVIIISFSKENLLNVKNQSSIKLQYLINEDAEKEMEFCIENHISPSISFTKVNKKCVQMAHDNDLEIGVWIVNMWGANIMMKAYRVDYITSDRFNK